MSVRAESGTPLVRRSLRALGGAWVGGVLANLVFAIVDGSRTTRLSVALTLLAVGAAGGWIASRDAGPWRAGDVRDGAIGWAIVVAIVAGSIAAAALPMPWGLIPGIVAFGLTVAFAFERQDATGAP